MTKRRERVGRLRWQQATRATEAAVWAGRSMEAQNERAQSVPISISTRKPRGLTASGSGEANYF